jgi:hypothetical protein
MSALILHVLAWPTLGTAVLVFGSAPGVVLRMILFCYDRNNPRRQELLSELYDVPRIERPFWVAEQLELALFEGLRDRIKPLSERKPRSQLVAGTVAAFDRIGYRCPVCAAVIASAPQESRLSGNRIMKCPVCARSIAVLKSAHYGVTE